VFLTIEAAMKAMKHCRWLVPAAVALAAGAAQADPGDIHRVTAELANLRSGPSDETTVRSQVRRGDELIELRRDSNWIGVRVARTGEEGWIFGNLVDRVFLSQLGGDGIGDAGFQGLSEDFDRLVGRMSQQLGYRLFDVVDQADPGALRLMPTRDFLVYGGRDAHLATTLAVYQMWKNHQNGQPVSVMMLDDRGKPYITIEEETAGPDFLISVAALPSG
jgi:hypothetical protein